MAAVVRQGDKTTGVCNKGLPCCPHSRSGTSQSSSNVLINGLPVHRVNDTGPTNCPHGGTFKSISGSGSVIINGQPVVTVGDPTVCMSCGMKGTHTEGSPDVFIGG
jgi:uncharacterized Zn-binding protein involved in type VI secretion